MGATGCLSLLALLTTVGAHIGEHEETDLRCVTNAWPPYGLTGLYQFSGGEVGTSIEVCSGGSCPSKSNARRELPTDRTVRACIARMAAGICMTAATSFDCALAGSGLMFSSTPVRRGGLDPFSHCLLVPFLLPFRPSVRAAIRVPARRGLQWRPQRTCPPWRR